MVNLLSGIGAKLAGQPKQISAMRPPPLIHLLGPSQRAFAHAEIDRAPVGWTVRLRPARRSARANDKMHAMCSDLAKQVPWCGRSLTVAEWKRFAVAKVKKDQFIFDCDEFGQPDSTAIVVLSAHTAEMSNEEISLIITWLEWFGAQHKVVWSDEGPPGHARHKPTTTPRSREA